MLKYTVFNYKACPAEGIMKEMLTTVLFKLLVQLISKRGLIFCGRHNNYSLWDHPCSECVGSHDDGPIITCNRQTRNAQSFTVTWYWGLRTLV